MATITKDIIALAKKIDSAQEWEMDDCEALDIVAEIEECEDGIFYDIASDLAAQANAWLKEVDD
jgi:hypothetical protein